MVKLLSFLVVAACASRVVLEGQGAGPLAVAGPLLGALALALAASAHLDALAVACGALGGLLAAVLAPHSALLAGAALGVAVYAERTLRVQGRGAQALHVLLAVLGGAAAGVVSVRFAQAAWLHQGASFALAGALLAAPLVVRADDPTEHLLVLASGSVGEASAAALRQAAELRRWSLHPACSTRTDHRLQRRWSALGALVRQRVALPAVTAARAGDSYRDATGDEGPEARQARSLDGEIDELVAELRRSYGQPA